MGQKKRPGQLLDPVDAQTIASQGYYFIVRYYTGREKGVFVTEREALRKAVYWDEPGFQIVRIPLR